MEAALTLPHAEAVAAFEDAYVDRARRELDDRLAAAEAAVLDRRALAGGGTALAGWWCPPDAGPGLVVLPNPWDDRDAIAAHDAYCWELSEPIVDDLAAGLNRHHGVERGREYWSLVLGSWLLYVLSAALDRRLYCVALSRLRPDVPLAGGPALPVPATMVDAVELVRTDAGNRALGSELGRSLGLRPVELEQRPAVGSGGDAGGSEAGAGDSGAAAPLRSPLPHRALIALELAAGMAVGAAASARRGRRIALVGNVGLSRRDTLRLLRGVNGLRVAPGPRPTTVVTGSGGDRGTRERLAAELGGGEDRAGALASAACRLLPRTVLEDYPAVVERSASAYGAPCAAVAGNLGPHDAENEFLGRCAEAGHRLAFAQHGGTYLQARVNAQERLERRPGSVFLSWGGRGEGVRPLPSLHLSRIRDRHRGGDRVVVIEWIVPPDPYLIRFASTPLGNQGYRQSALLADFVGSVKTARDHLFLKRFPAFVEGAERDPAVAALPHRAPAARRTATRLMAGARLAVITYPDTPFIEAMALGVPTVGLWDPDLWELRDDARAPFEGLRAAGVLHSDPRDAAAHVDRVYDRAGEWWAGADVRSARAGFLDRFAPPGDAVAEWAAFLREPGWARA